MPGEVLAAAHDLKPGWNQRAWNQGQQLVQPVLIQIETDQLRSRALVRPHRTVVVCHVVAKELSVTHPMLHSAARPMRVAYAMLVLCIVSAAVLLVLDATQDQTTSDTPLTSTLTLTKKLVTESNNARTTLTPPAATSLSALLAERFPSLKESLAVTSTFTPASWQIAGDRKSVV